MVVSHGGYTFWRHQPCNETMSFDVEDRPNDGGEYCEICRVTDKRWEFDSLRDVLGHRIDFEDR